MSIEEQIHITGIILGWIIVAGYIWLVMNYFVKVVNHKIISKLPQNSSFRKRYSWFMQAVIRTHPYVPLFLISVILLHLIMELIHTGFFITGIITISLMLIQIILGIYGTYIRNKKRGLWFYAHRTVSIMLGLSIIIHIISVIVINP